MSDLQGAEFAPSIVVGYVTERGGFYATLDAVPMITLHNGERVKVPYVEAVRQLSCDDPDDMRAIWRLAALTFGLSEDESCGALLYPRWKLVTDARYQWSDEWILCHPATHTDKSAPLPRFWRLYAVDGAPVLNAPDVKHATAALCAHVWGPK